MTYSTIGK